MTLITYQDRSELNPSLEAVLDPNGLITARTSTVFEITNQSGGAWDGFVFRLEGSGFAYDPDTGTPIYAYENGDRTGGTITGGAILDPEGNMVAQISDFDSDDLAYFGSPGQVWERLQTGGSVHALNGLIGSRQTAVGSSGADHLVVYCNADMGSGASSILYGMGGDDTLVARGGLAPDSMDPGVRVQVEGGAGDDLIRLESGWTSVHGGAGDGTGGEHDTDVLEVAWDRATLSQMTNIDVIRFESGSLYFELSAVRLASVPNDLVVEGNGDLRFYFRPGRDVTVGFAVNLDFSGWTFVNRTSGEGAYFNLIDDYINEFMGTPSYVGFRVTGTQLRDTIYTSAGADILDGHGGDDRIQANRGNDVVRGGDGDDILDGGADIDTSSYATAAAGVTVSLAISGSQNTRGAGWDTLIGIENLTGSALGDQLAGNGGANVLRGEGGADRLSGSGGTDTLVGGAANDVVLGGGGNDTYLFGLSDGSDTITESGSGLADAIRIQANGAALSGLSFLASSGNLVIRFNGQSITVSSHFAGGVNVVEKLSFVGGASFAGFDLGSSSFLLSSVNTSSRNGTSGNDILAGGTGNETMFGSAGIDILSGSGGGDRLAGGGHRDLLIGGAGGDVFDFNATAESVKSSYDVIADFERGTDKIDLSTIDARAASTTNEAFRFRGQEADVLAYSVTWYERNGRTFIQADNTGDNIADMLVAVRGTNLGLSGSDFSL